MDNVFLIDDQIDLGQLHDLQARVPPVERWLLADRIAETFRSTLAGMGVSASTSPDSARLDSLRAQGLVEFGRLLTTDETQSVVEHFLQRPCYRGHHFYRSDGVSRSVDASEPEIPFASYPLRDVCDAPYLLELANRPDILALVESYLGCTPTLFSLNCWWSFSANARPENMTQHLHRDRDDFRFCTLFMYLTDVDRDTGPHVFLRGTHDPSRFTRQSRGSSDLDRNQILNAEIASYDRAANAFFAGGTIPSADTAGDHDFVERAREITGESGTAFLVDNFGLHFGRPLARGRRLMFWARYGLYKNATYAEQYTGPLHYPNAWGRIENSARSIYVNRLLLRS